MAVIPLVEKGGRARSKVTTSVTANNLRKHLTKNIDPKATLMTDELPAYRAIGKNFAAHKTVRHSTREYVGKEGQHSNEAESYFATLKRGIYGTFHHVSPQHLHRFVSEFDFRWSNREVSDTERTFRALAQADGKRLTYRKTVDVTNVN